ncbi:MAG: hypothetical protein IKO25_03845 [Clostridia bacterium]|nr:hypothetical protein [Clostridia bacterium]
MRQAENQIDVRAAIQKKSFELHYNGGTIWCEHLDGMKNREQEVIVKFNGNLPELLRPSVSSCMIINLDETVITEDIEQAIVDGLNKGKKRFKKISLVGVDRKHQIKFITGLSRTGAAVKFLDDYEKAKEWVL